MRQSLDHAAPAAHRGEPLPRRAGVPYQGFGPLTPGTAYEQWRGDAPLRSVVFEKQSCCLWGVGGRDGGVTGRYG